MLVTKTGVVVVAGAVVAGAVVAGAVVEVVQVEVVLVAHSGSSSHGVVVAAGGGGGGGAPPFGPPMSRPRPTLARPRTSAPALRSRSAFAAAAAKTIAKIEDFIFTMIC